MREVPEPEDHPYVYGGDAENGLDIDFENEEYRQIYLKMKNDGQILLKGDDCDDYIAEV